MKENEPSPLTFEYESYFLTQLHHADAVKDCDNGNNTAYRDSLLAKLEAAVIEAGGPGIGSGAGPEIGTAQSGLTTQSPSQPPPRHIPRNRASDRPSFSSSRSAVAVGVEHNSNGIGIGGRGDLSAAKDDGFTNDSSSNASSKPFQASILTNAGGSSSPTTSVETSDPFPQAASHHHLEPQHQQHHPHPVDANDDVVDGDDDNVDGLMVVPSGHGENDGRSIDGLPSESRASRLYVSSDHNQSQQLQPQQQQQLREKQGQEAQGRLTDAEDNRTGIGYHHQRHQHRQPQPRHHGVDFVAQSRMDIEIRRQHKSTGHLPPAPLSVAKMPKSAAVFTTKQKSRVSDIPPFHERHIDARRDYSSPRVPEDFGSTRPGPISQRSWNTSLSPRPPVSPLGTATIDANRQAAQDGQQRGYKSEEERGEQKRKSSVRLSGLLPDPSPGHQMHPAIEPGPLYGVRRPKFTYRHALYDVPFYGIENLEISSSRYEVLTQSNSPKELEMLNDPLRDTRTSGDSGRSSGAGVGVGVGGEGGGDGLLREHREHIWSVAHEEEYGSSEATAAAEGVEENGLHRGRHKRTQRILPIAHLPPPAATESTSGSGSGSVEIQRHYSKDKNRAETTTARGRGRREPGMRIEVDHGSHFELTNMETISSVGALSTTTRNSNGVLFLTSDRGRHGHGHGHGYGHRRSSRPPRPPRPVSQGVYGPDSFQESLDKLKNTPERPTGPIPKLLGIVRRHWKTWLCVGTLLAVAIVAPLMLKRKGVSGGDKGIASAGQGGGDEGDDIFYDGDTTSAEEPTNGVGRKVVTKSATPSASSTRNVKVTPTSTSHSSASTSTPPSSTATHTSSQATVRRSSIARTTSRLRPKAFAATTSTSASGKVARTRKVTS